MGYFWFPNRFNSVDGQRERGLLVDVDGFNKDGRGEGKIEKCPDKQAGGTIVMDADATSTLHKTDVLATYDSSKYIWFQDHESEVKAIYTGSAFLESSAAGEKVSMLSRVVRFSTRDLLRVRSVHSTYAMFKYLEALFFILVISLKKLESYLWEIK